MEPAGGLKMSFELRLRTIKKNWLEVQELRDERARQRKIQQKAQKRVRQLSQEIPKKLNEFNKSMV